MREHEDGVTRPGHEGPGRPESAAEAHAIRWQGLRTLTRARLLVATLALPIGVLFRPEAGEESWWVVGWALLAVGVLSILFWLAIRLKRGLGLQTYLQLTSDLTLVTWLSARTGGRESQFVLFFALVVVTGGLVGRLPGGLFAASLACAALLLLPHMVAMFPVSPADSLRAALPAPGTFVAFLVLMGILSGVLGHRVQNARTELARTAQELARVRVDNDLILRHLTTGVLTVDGSGRIAYVNPAAEQVLGLGAAELCGRPLAQALPARLEALRQVMERTLAEHTPRARVELLVESAEGTELPLGISTNPLVHRGDVTGVVAVFQDLTEAKEMERRARRNQTLAEVGALAAGIAHELRNGLKPISGSVEYLQRELKPEGESAVLMDLIAVESNRLNRFITDLLNYSRERDLALEPLDVGEHLDELCDELSRDPGRPEMVEVRCERGLAGVRVPGDREQLRQVWLNLANNAFEAMSGGGTLVVRWREEGGRRVLIEFEDSGVGIAPHDLPHVGEPFFTTKEKGTGLGIALAQRIVERHGGTLSFECPPGRGTIARVALPDAGTRLARAA
jgi:two-component system sensor histidine kinase PilS (NtrC family)